MPSQTRRKAPGKGRASRRRARGAADQPTRAQIQAIEARSRAVAAPTEDETPAPEERPQAAPRASGARARERPRPTAIRPLLSRAQEFAYIRSDLRRLVVTAGPLLVLMIALLFVIDR